VKRLVRLLLLPAMMWAQTAPDEIRVSSHAYVPPSPYSIRVETKLVELNVTVHDWNGRAVHGLTRENFRIYDEGKEREIAAFSEEASAASEAGAVAPDAAKPDPGATPTARSGVAQERYLALLIDDVNAKDWFASGDLLRTQTAARKFVAEALAPGTRIGVFTVSGAVTQDFTNDAPKLAEAIASLKAHQRMSEIGMALCPRVTPYRAYEIAHLHDRQTLDVVTEESAALHCMAPRDEVTLQAEETWRRVREISIDTLAAIDRAVGYLGKMPGARVLVIASSGFFGETLEDQQQAVIDHAIHAGVVINSLDSKGIYSEPPPGCRPWDPSPANCQYRWVSFENNALADRLMVVNSSMADIAHGTGGEFFHNNNDLHAGLHQLGVPPEVTYRMSFKPEGVTPDGSFHKLKVKLARAGNYDVVARPGYFAPKDQPTDDPRAKFDRAVAASDTIDDFPAGLAIQIGRPSPARRTLSVVVRIDVSKLDFARVDGKRKQRIAFVSALLDSQGKMVAAKEGWMDLALTQETYDRLVKTGLNAELSLEVPPGVYGLREVVEEAVSGKLSSATHQVDLK